MAGKVSVCASAYKQLRIIIAIKNIFFISLVLFLIRCNSMNGYLEFINKKYFIAIPFLKLFFMTFIKTIVILPGL